MDTEEKLKLIEEAKKQGFTGRECLSCGSFKTHQNGGPNCLICTQCGNAVGGCSI